MLIILIPGLTRHYAQDAAPSPTPPNVEDRNAPVTVTQGFIDDATKAFDLVAEQKTALERYARFEKLTETERANVDRVLKSFDELIAVKDRTIAATEKLNLIYVQMIEFQQKMIDKLQTMLTKPKTFWQKFLAGVKEIIKAIIYIGIGRGLAANPVTQLNMDILVIQSEMIDILLVKKHYPRIPLIYVSGFR